MQVCSDNEDRTRQEETELSRPKTPRAESGPTLASAEKGNEPTAGAGSCDGAISAFASSRQHKLRRRSATVVESVA